MNNAENNDIEFWLNGKKKSFKEIKKPNHNTDNKINFIKRVLKNKKMEAYYVDVTIPKIRNCGYKIIKSIIPQAQQMYFIHKLPLISFRRMEEIKNIKCIEVDNGINDFPHPFL